MEPESNYNIAKKVTVSNIDHWSIDIEKEITKYMAKEIQQEIDNMILVDVFMSMDEYNYKHEFDIS